MNLIKKYATKSDCYKAGERGKRNSCKGLMLHSVGCNQPSAEVFYRIWNAPNNNVCPQAVIDATSDKVIQILPWEWRGWHGGGKSNDTHIGVEMCEPDCIKYTKGANFTYTSKERAVEMVKRTYITAVELFAYLCIQYDLNPMKKGVIISHSEGYKMGIATGHADPEHLWKKLDLKYTMDTFRLAVKNMIDVLEAEAEGKYQGTNGEIKEEIKEETKGELYRVRESKGNSKTQIGAFTNLDNAKKACKKGYYVFDSSWNVVYAGDTSLRPIDEVARDVIAGRYGNGAERKRKLEAEGYNYNVVQSRVNDMIDSGEWRK